MHSDEITEAGGSRPVSATHSPEAESSQLDEAQQHVHLPPPSIWPMTMAGGVALGGIGLITAWPISIGGLIIMFVALINWIQELRHESH